MRTIISLDETRVRRLALFCRKRKTSRAEAVCQAVDLLVPESAGDTDGFGLWIRKRGEKKDSRKFVRGLRGEWT